MKNTDLKTTKGSILYFFAISISIGRMFYRAENLKTGEMKVFFFHLIIIPTVIISLVTIGVLKKFGVREIEPSNNFIFKKPENRQQRMGAG